jgi:hypothetical protein
MQQLFRAHSLAPRSENPLSVLPSSFRLCGDFIVDLLYQTDVKLMNALGSDQLCLLK